MRYPQAGFFKQMAKSSKLVAAKRGRVLLVRRTGFGCFPVAESAPEKAIKIVCTERSKKSFPNSNLDALGFGRKLNLRTAVRVVE
jgi:hypothetical protein